MHKLTCCELPEDLENASFCSDASEMAGSVEGVGEPWVVASDAPDAVASSMSCSAKENPLGEKLCFTSVQHTHLSHLCSRLLAQDLVAVLYQKLA